LAEYLFHLSGANKTLPGAEVMATLEALEVKFEVVHSHDQTLVVRAEGLKEAPERLALCHGTYEFLGLCEPRIEDILALAKEVAPSLSPPIAVRVKRIKGHSRELRRDRLEQLIGAAIGKEVNLSEPKSLVVGFLAEKFLLGRKIHAPRRDYSHRHPKTRPFFRPGVLLPKTARAVVNLTRIKPGEALMDPFCGTGSFLIEAGLIGAKVYGCDISSEMVQGCRENLEHYGIKDYHLEVGDARVIGARYLNCFDAIATDPPYGISASTKGLSLEDLYSEAFNSFYEMLKEGGYACVLAPMKLETEKYAARAGFNVVETHYDRVHGGLTRKILVVRKWR
jgi:tRNA (guanine10-N2)-dimethyltransferase